MDILIRNEDTGKSLGFRINDKLEFCTSDDSIVIKKHDEVNNIEDFRDSVANAKHLIYNACRWYAKTKQSQHVVDNLCEIELSLADVLSLTETFE